MRNRNVLAKAIIGSAVFITPLLLIALSAFAQATDATSHMYNAATLGTGSDIGAKVNSIFANAGYFATNKYPKPASGTVQIPFGTYTQTTPIVIPIIANSVTTLQCDPGTVLNFTGKGNAISAIFSLTTANVMIRITGCEINGSNAATGANGVMLDHFYGSFLQDIHANNFSTGSGIVYQGSGVSTCINCWARGNQYGVKILSSGPTGKDRSGTAPNGIHWYGGAIENNRTWGVYNDFLDLSKYGPGYNISFEGVDFEYNGTASAYAGQILIQELQNVLINNNYFATNRGTENIQVGVTGTARSTNVQITNNHMETTKTGASSIDAQSLTGGIISGNTEIINTGTFLELGSRSTVDVRNNVMQSHAKLMAGNVEGAASSNSGTLNATTVNVESGYKINGAAVAPAFRSAGVPTMACQVGDTDTNSSATSASTVFYVCFPANKWTAVAVH
jgi:hypothetical protein